MTKQQTTVRVSPDTLAAIDAEAERLGVSRGNVIDRWLAAQAVATHAQPIEAQAWYRAGQLAAKARDAQKNAQFGDALNALADAIDVLAGTAPEEE